jgi:hypothetical protein
MPPPAARGAGDGEDSAAECDAPHPRAGFVWYAHPEEPSIRKTYHPKKRPPPDGWVPVAQIKEQARVRRAQGAAAAYAQPAASSDRIAARRAKMQFALAFLEQIAEELAAKQKQDDPKRFNPPWKRIVEIFDLLDEQTTDRALHCDAKEEGRVEVLLQIVKSAAVNQNADLFRSVLTQE